MSPARMKTSPTSNGGFLFTDWMKDLDADDRTRALCVIVPSLPAPPRRACRRRYTCPTPADRRSASGVWDADVPCLTSTLVCRASTRQTMEVPRPPGPHAPPRTAARHGAANRIAKTMVRGVCGSCPLLSVSLFSLRLSVCRSLSLSLSVSLCRSVALSLCLWGGVRDVDWLVGIGMIFFRTPAQTPRATRFSASSRQTCPPTPKWTSESC